MAFAIDPRSTDHSPSPRLVVVQVHQLAALLGGATLVVLLPLADVHEALGEFVSILDVVSASAPDPLLVEVLWSAGGRAPTRGQLAVPARSRHAIYDARRGDGVGEGGFSTRDLQDGSEHGGVVNSGAVPASVSELPLALMDASLGAAANAAHVVLVQLAQLGLAGGEAGDLGAEGLRADQVDLRVPPYFVALETEIHPRADEPSDRRRGEAEEDDHGRQEQVEEAHDPHGV